MKYINTRPYWSLLCCLLFGTIATAQKFVNELPIPYLIDSDTVQLKIDVVEHNFNPNGTDKYNRSILAFAYNHIDSTAGVGGGLTLLGPSIKWRFGHNVHTTVKNNLKETTTTHWHGAHIPTHTDGGPHQPILAGATWDINFDIMDKSATMWYHPHQMDKTYEHVQMGLSGMIYVADPPDGDDDSILVELHELLPTEYGINDFPIIAQTKYLTPDCIYRGGFGTSKATSLINGVMNPYLKVPADMIRLRVLNGDAKFSYNFKIGHQVEEVAEGALLEEVDSVLYQLDTFQMIATDAGYMDQSYAKTEILISPGERTEWLLDLRDRVGDTLYILNIRGKEGLEKGVIGGGLGKTVQLEIIVGEPETKSDITQFPIPLHPLAPPTVFDYTRERVKIFEKATSNINPNTNSEWVFDDLQTQFNSTSKLCMDSIVELKGRIPYLIDQTPMDMMVVNDTVWFDSTEVWTLDNRSDIAHPFHIHDIHFYVTKIDVTHYEIDTISYDSMKMKYILDTVNIFYTPIPQDSLPHIFKGPKDNVLVNPNWRLSFVTKFTDHATTTGVADSSYMYHCHILPHEDRGMMGQFVVMYQPDMVTAVDDPIIFNNTMKLYPNPARDQLFLDGESDETTQIRIFDLQGRVIYQQKIAPFAGTHRIPIGTFNKGMIFVEWWTSEGRFINKVIVE